jgi:hypothetical protein
MFCEVPVNVSVDYLGTLVDVDYQRVRLLPDSCAGDTRAPVSKNAINAKKRIPSAGLLTRETLLSSACLIFFSSQNQG